MRVSLPGAVSSSGTDPHLGRAVLARILVAASWSPRCGSHAGGAFHQAVLAVESALDRPSACEPCAAAATLDFLDAESGFKRAHDRRSPIEERLWAEIRKSFCVDCASGTFISHCEKANEREQNRFPPPPLQRREIHSDLQRVDAHVIQTENTKRSLKSRRKISLTP